MRLAMSIKPKDIIKGFKGIERDRKRLEIINDEIVRLSAIMYSAKTATIKQEHEMGNGDFGNAYKTPMLNEIELMDKLEKEKNKIENRIKALYAIRDKCSELVKHLINNIFIEKLYYMNEYSDMLDIHQTTLNRRLNKDLTKIINNA